jgi:hypothetical protein
MLPVVLVGKKLTEICKPGVPTGEPLQLPEKYDMGRTRDYLHSHSSTRTNSFLILKFNQNHMANIGSNGKRGKRTQELSDHLAQIKDQLGAIIEFRRGDVAED